MTQYLQNIANFAQALSALVAVIALLIVVWQVFLLRRQIEESTRTQRTSQYQAALQLIFDWRSDVIDNPDLAKRFVDPNSGSDYFPEILKHQSVEGYFHTLKLFHIFEIFFLLYKEGVITKEMWEGWENNANVVMSIKLNQELWEKVKGKQAFNSDFVQIIDQIVKSQKETLGVR
jgi:hypothetical protein